MRTRTQGHDVVLIDGDRLAGYAMGVPDGTSPFGGHPQSPPSAAVRASRALRPEQERAASSATTPGGTPSPTAPVPSTPAPGAERPTPPSAADREVIRSSAARLGHLPPQSLDEATYPAAWFAPREREHLSGAVS
jgi:hypothetical protein